MTEITNKSLPVIGFLSTRIDEPYQYSIWHGAEEESLKLGVQLVFFSVQRGHGPDEPESLDEVSIDLAQRTKLSGLIIVANVISNYSSAKEQTAFIKHFGSIPIITIGTTYKGAECVAINSKGAMKKIIGHLVEKHHRKNFMFIEGLSAHKESAERKKEFIEQYNAFFPDSSPPVILKADFKENDAHDVVADFIASGGSVDAIVASNDLMAFGAIKALTDAGINVPTDVSVTGYDDSENSRYSIPPLTTIHQSSEDLGKIAIQKIAYKIGLRTDTVCQKIPKVSFVIRQSCGCINTDDVCCTELFKSLFSSLQKSKTDEEYLASLVQIVNTELRAGRNPNHLHKIIFPKSLQEKASIIITEGEMHYHALLRTKIERRIAEIQGMGSSLFSSFDLNDVLKEVANAIKSLGIAACWLVLFDSPEKTPVWARLHLIYKNETVRILTPYGLRFRTSELLPGGLAQDINSYVCEPLRYGNERLGYLICTVEPTERRIFETLKNQISGAIKGARLVNAERDREKKLEEEVRERTSQLYTTNDRLLKEIKQRQTLEHELLQIANNIMGNIGRDIHDHLCQDIVGIGLKAALIDGMIKHSGRVNVTEISQELQEIIKASGKTADLAKSIARGLYPAELEAHGLVKTIESLVLTTRKRSKAKITLKASPLFSINDSEKALQLYRIIQEAMGNAVTHSDATEIEVNLLREDQNIIVIVRDNGKGIPKNIQKRHGMGLNIMKYRASVIMGELSIISDSQGTEIKCKVEE